MRAFVLLTLLTAVISAPAELNQQALEGLIKELEAEIRSELPVILEGIASIDAVVAGTPAPSRTFTPAAGELMVQGVASEASDAPPARTFTPQAGQLLVQGVGDTNAISSIAPTQPGPPRTFTPQAGQLLVQGVVADLQAAPPTPAPTRPRPRPQRPPVPSAAPIAAPAPPP